MLWLPDTARAWGTPEFRALCKQELRTQAASLPLDAGLARSSRVLDDSLEVLVLGASEAGERLDLRVGVVYSGCSAGCGCADDPTPLDETTEYCELLIQIDRASGAASVTLAEPDS